MKTFKFLIKTLKHDKINKKLVKELTIVVDIAITIDISFFYHILDLGICQLFTQVHHHTTQLGRRYYAIVILVEHPAKS